MLVSQSSSLMRTLNVQTTNSGFPGVSIRDGVVDLGEEGLRMGVLYDLTRERFKDFGNEDFKVVWKKEEVVGVSFSFYTSCNDELDESDEALGTRFISEACEKVQVRVVKQQWLPPD